MNKTRYIASKTLSVKLLYFMAYAAFAAWTPYFYVYLKEFPHLSGFEIGVIAAIQQISSLVVVPVWGVWSDRYGRKRMLLLALGVSAVLLCVFMIQLSFLFYVLFMLAFTMVYNPMATLFDGVALEVEEQVRVVPYGQMRLWASIGWASSSLVTGIFINTQHLQYIFPLASAMMLITCVLVAVFYRTRASRKMQETVSFEQVWRQIVSQPSLLRFLIIILIYSVFAAPVMLIVNMYYNEIGATTLQTGAAFAVQSVCEIPFFFFGKRIVQRFGARESLLIAMGFTAVRMVGYGFTSSPNVAIAIGALHGFSMALFLVSMVEYVQALMPSNMRSSGQSAIYTAFAAGTCFGNLLIGWMHDVMSIQRAMLFCAALVVVLIVVLQVAKRGVEVRKTMGKVVR